MVGIPHQYVPGTHFNNWVKRHNVEQSFVSKETTQQLKRPSQPRTTDPPIDRSKFKRGYNYTASAQGEHGVDNGLVKPK